MEIIGSFPIPRWLRIYGVVPLHLWYSNKTFSQIGSWFEWGVLVYVLTAKKGDEVWMNSGSQPLSATPSPSKWNPINACLRFVIQVMKQTIEETQHLASNHKYNGTTTRSLQTTEMKEQYSLLGLARNNTKSKRHGTGSVSLESGPSTADQVIYQPLLDPKTT